MDAANFVVACCEDGRTVLHAIARVHVELAMDKRYVQGAHPLNLSQTLVRKASLH